MQLFQEHGFFPSTQATSLFQVTMTPFVYVGPFLYFMRKKRRSHVKLNQFAVPSKELTKFYDSGSASGHVSDQIVPAVENSGSPAKSDGADYDAIQWQ